MEKVLIADDSKTVRRIFKNALLNSIDYIQTDEEHILEAENGLDLVAFVKNNDDIKYLLVDIDMPLLDGDNAIVSLINQGFLEDAKVVFITANSVAPSTLLHNCVKGVISKPVNIEKLNNRLKSLIFSKEELMNDDDRKELRQKIDEQKSLLSNVILKYLSNFEETKTLKEDFFAKDLEECYEDAEILPDNDLIPVVEEFVSNIFRARRLKADVDKKKIEFIFNNIKEVSTGIEDTILSDSKALKAYVIGELGDDSSTFDRELKAELERYIEVINRYKNKLQVTDEFSEFRRKFADDDLLLLHKFLTEIVFDFAKKLDFSIESEKLKILMLDMELFLRSIKIFKTIELYKEDGDFDNKSYSDFLTDKKKHLILINRHLYFTFIKTIMSQMRKSDEVLKYFANSNSINRITMGSLVSYFKDSTDYEKVGLKPEDFKKLHSKLEEPHISVLFLTSMAVNIDEDLAIVKKFTDQQFTSFNFYAFTQDSVLQIWLKNKQKADIIFIDDAYDDNQERKFIDVQKGYPDIFKDSKLVLLSTGQTAMEDKELLKSADTFMKRPLSVEKISKYLLSV
jgi:CheY-like chemotaxis protein